MIRTNWQPGQIFREGDAQAVADALTDLCAKVDVICDDVPPMNTSIHPREILEWYESTLEKLFAAPKFQHLKQTFHTRALTILDHNRFNNLMRDIIKLQEEVETWHESG